MERCPLRHSHHKMPALAVEAAVKTRSVPGFATAPMTPRAQPSRTMKKMTFQKRATLV